jgi:hypothetical protein
MSVASGRRRPRPPFPSDSCRYTAVFCWETADGVPAGPRAVEMVEPFSNKVERNPPCLDGLPRGFPTSRSCDPQSLGEEGDRLV